VQRAASTSVIAASGGTGAIGVFGRRCQRTGCSFGKRSRRCRSCKGIASIRVRAKRVVFATLATRASALRSTVSATCGHRRL